MNAPGGALPRAGLGFCGGLTGKVFEELGHPRAHLRAIAAPMRHSLEAKVQTNIVAVGNRVKVTQSLDESSVSAVARICCHHMIKRAFVGTTAGESNNDHDVVFLK